MSPAPTLPASRPDAVADARRHPAAIPLAVWAVLLGALAGIQAGFGGHLLPVLVQGGAAALIGLLALAIGLTGRLGERRAAGLRAAPELSIASALAAVSIAAMLAGASIGTWLIIGGGLGLALAAGGLIREHRAQRQAARAAHAALDGGSSSRGRSR